MLKVSINQVVGANVRRLRQKNNVSVSELSRRSGVSKATLSILEQGDGNPTVQTLTQLSEALGVMLGDLLEDRTTSLLRAGEGTRIKDRTSSGRFLGRVDAAAVDIYEITFRPGATHRSQLMTSGAVERLYVLSGLLEVCVGDETVTLSPGDMLRYSLKQGADIAAAGGAEAQVLLLMSFTQPGQAATRNGAPA